jgi:DNA-binding transcriptional LysR family regulator
MESLSSLATFVCVVDAGSFSAAARKLNVSPAAVGKQIATLEKWLGARLFDRTTRRLRATEAGTDFYERARRILGEIEAAQQFASAAQSEPRGVLRVSAPVSFAALYLGRALSQFLKAHAHVSVDVQLDDARVSLLEGNFDCAIRIGQVTESHVVARRVGEARFALCAAPSYISEHGEPKRPQQLVDHACLRYTLGSERWRFTAPDGTHESVEFTSRFKSNNGMVLAAAAVEGMGITYTPEFIVASALRSRQLVRLMPRYTTTSAPIYVIFPAAGRYVPMKIRKFIEFVAQALKESRAQTRAQKI